MKTTNIVTKPVATDDAIEQLLWNCLAEVPFLQIVKVEQRVFADASRPEVIARVRIGAQERILLAEVKRNGQSRLVREAIENILRYRQTYADSYALVIAPSFTAQSAKICRQEGIGYLDLAGNCWLNFDHVFINSSGRILPKQKRPPIRTWYSARVERVLRVLLMQPNRTWKTRELAMEAHVKPGQALSIKHFLAQRAWVEDGRQGFRVTEPGLLLDEWAEHYPAGKSAERVFSSSRSIVELEAMLASVCQEQVIPYALMGYSAAMRYNPQLHYQRVSAYVLSDLSKVISALELTESSGSKGNVSLWIPHDEGVLRGSEQFDHARVTPLVQTYMDLIGQEGKGEKEANHLWQTLMRERWETKLAPAA
ncbi:MAG TPA: type IV toxin-antitoxin system AbiEi family antitoxin [Verrucomicrobiae bacterium]|nr:type IV toxin-antitoxin system AbiEi family antitoxin [Verrucomicrobiae bacterium]